ncbi:MAG: DUF4159 domain-containing protein [Hyphomicrobiales bacterium]
MIWQIGSLAFLNPWALAALIALPVLWYLLRFTPPKPETVAFPPFRFLLDLISREETPHRTPWWLILLRLLAVSCIILAIAEPVLNQPRPAERGSGPVLLVIDDGWASGKTWQRVLSAADQALDRAARQSRPVIAAFTSPRLTPQVLEPVRAEKARDTISAARPSPLAPDRLSLAAALKAKIAEISGLEVVWLSDGIDYGNGGAFASQLTEFAGGAGDVTVVLADATTLPVLATGISLGDGNLSVNLKRIDGGIASGERAGLINALALNGRNLANVPYSFTKGATETSAKIEMPIALRNEVSRIELAEARSAASVYLVDDTWRRKSVGLVSGVNTIKDQPLLSPLYYVSRALEPYAEVKIAPADEAGSGIRELIDGGLSVLILADIGKLQAVDHDAVEQWLEKGGTLVRFAGPRLAARQDDLVPVPLRQGGRALGGALSWSSPQQMSPFDEKSPFFGLNITEEVTVNRQVLAEPLMELSERTWARLEDGTPLVTAAKRGTGTVVLFHVTAEPSWSNLPLSGLFVEMLRRMVSRSQGIIGSGEGPLATTEARQSGAYAPVRALNGYGELTTPPVDAAPIPAANIKTVKPGPEHPPGFYRRGGLTRAINAVEKEQKFAVLSNFPSGVTVTTFSPLPVVPLKAAFMVAAFLLLIIDALASLWLSGRLSRRHAPMVTTSIAGLLIALVIALNPANVRAQERDNSATAQNDYFAMRATLDTRLAYVLTGKTRVDSVIAAGLEGLTEVLFSRTSLEPEKPVGIDIEKDDIVFFPFIYWPVEPDAPRPSDAALAKISAYLKNGGTIFFDTRDHQRAMPGLSADGSTGNQALRRILSGLDIPPLETVPPDHVITKAFYLLHRFPGRWAGGKLWVEATDRDKVPGTTGTSSTDGVSSIIIGSNDYAGAWAIEESGQPMFATVPGTNRQREFAMRTGVNIVMYALTGNYKADQVHVPSILERLGQ